MTWIGLHCLGVFTIEYDPLLSTEEDEKSSDPRAAPKI